MRYYANSEFIFNDFLIYYISLLVSISVEIVLLYFKNKKFAIPPMESVIKFYDRSKMLLNIGTKVKAKSQILYISQN